MAIDVLEGVFDGSLHGLRRIVGKATGGLAQGLQALLAVGRMELVDELNGLSLKCLGQASASSRLRVR
jgi:hypothetical protein